MIEDNRPHKPPLDPEALRDAMSLSIWAGQMLLQHGADSARVEETVHRIGTGLGADWMDILVTSDSIVATTVNNHEFRTKVRRAPTRGINMALIDRVSALSYQAASGKLDRFALRARLREMDYLKPEYNRWWIVLAVGLACAAISRFFGGDLAAFGITFAAAALAMALRQELAHHHLNFILVTASTAFVASGLAALGTMTGVSATPSAAISASVLLLVPGVPLINGTKDLINGYPMNGVARGVNALVIVLCIAVGLSAALWITGVTLP
ncbi:threonine/serine exporter family protein [Aggregatilineales bacterium SYSU G02658]